MINWQELSVFIVVFVGVTSLGFGAARWRSGDLNRLQEWGLAGRRFGPIISWFLLGADTYTAYTFIAAPGLIFAVGALGFFAVPFVVMIYPIFFLVMPKFWTIARHRGYVTPADFVRERFDSSTLALCVAITGILATMPYIALQIFGIEVSLAQMGVPVEISLVLAFGILAAYTYISGLRAPAMIAVVKNVMIWIVVLVAFVSIPVKLGGFGHIFAAIPAKNRLLLPTDYSAYTTLALGSALALFLFPHTLTGVLSTNSGQTVKRNASFLPAYSLLIAMLLIIGYMAVAVHIKPSPVYGVNAIIPAFFTTMFPSWFAGFSLAALAVSALTPAAIMAIASANLFTRNVYREFIKPTCTDHEEAHVARVASLIVKFGALGILLFFPTKFAINLQLLSNIWILQTLPAVFLGLYTKWFHRHALILGLIAGMITGTWMVIARNFESSVYPLQLGPVTIPTYAAIGGLIVNLLVCTIGTFLFRNFGVDAGEDYITSEDFLAHPVTGYPQSTAGNVLMSTTTPTQPLSQPTFTVQQLDNVQQPVQPSPKYTATIPRRPRLVR